LGVARIAQPAHNPSVGYENEEVEYLNGKRYIGQCDSLPDLRCISMQKRTEETSVKIKAYYERHVMGHLETPVSRDEMKMRGEIIEECVKGFHPHVIIDIGCGAGYISNRISCYGTRYIGLDVSLNALRKAKNDSHTTAVFVNALGEFLPLKDGVADTIILSEVIEHVPAYETCIEEIRRITKSGGVLVLTTPHYLNISVFLRYHLKERITSQIFDRPISHTTIIRELEKNGFSVKKINTFYFHVPFGRNFPFFVQDFLRKISEKIGPTALNPFNLYLIIVAQVK
jgi:ubiquinone/menaquinone biosynthesis C-methylase UbiE